MKSRRRLRTATARGNGADWPRIFGRRAPLCAEIGSGDGEALAQRALAMPQADFVAIEIYRPGLGRLFTRLRDLGIDNVKAAPTDAVAAMRQFFADGALAEIAVFFPDPWPKTRQQKRRLIDESFACLAARKIAVGGLFRLATDDAGYARAMRQAAAAARDENGGGFSPIAAPARPPTKYERRARESRARFLIWRLSRPADGGGLFFVVGVGRRVEISSVEKLQRGDFIDRQSHIKF